MASPQVTDNARSVLAELLAQELITLGSRQTPDNARMALAQVVADEHDGLLTPEIMLITDRILVQLYSFGYRVAPIRVSKLAP